jgi:hypothetical protein
MAAGTGEGAYSMSRPCCVEHPLANENRWEQKGIFCNIRDMKKAGIEPAFLHKTIDTLLLSAALELGATD